jgi:porin
MEQWRAGRYGEVIRQEPIKWMATAAFSLAVVTSLWSSPTSAQSDPFKGVAPQPSITSFLPAHGDPYGIRRSLSELGVTYGFVHTFDVFSNVHGGIRTGTVAGGKLEAMFGVDFGKLAGIEGLGFFANAFQLHGDSGPGRNLVGNRNTISNIEALPTTRLSEAWFEQTFAGGGASLRAGQIVVDTEFLFSQYFSFFVSSDWPTNPAVNIPNGGAAYPLSTPGVRLKVDPTPDTTLLFAVFNGDPAGPCMVDPESCNRYGLNFRVNDPPFAIAEAQWRYNQFAKTTAPAGGLRFGGWHHFGKFNDLRFDTAGISLASPLAGSARIFRGDVGIYGVVDQQLYRPPGADADTGVLLFGRAAYSPPNRNLNDLYIDGGLIFAKMNPSRPNDSIGASFLYAHMSRAARGLDADLFLYTGVPVPLRQYELSLEFSYNAFLAPGWTVQPNLQFVFNPGGKVGLPTDPTRPIPNATLIGLRSMLRF